MYRAVLGIWQGCAGIQRRVSDAQAAEAVSSFLGQTCKLLSVAIGGSERAGHKGRQGPSEEAGRSL